MKKLIIFATLGALTFAANVIRTTGDSAPDLVTPVGVEQWDTAH